MPDRAPLELADVPERVWTRFQEGMARGPMSALAQRWLRARQLGAASEGPADEEQLLRGPALELRSERMEPVCAAGAAVLDGVTDLLAARDYVVLLADADGVVLRAGGGGAFAQQARRVRLIEGASWSEAARGTNAIGTAIAEERPAFVEGHAHYGRRFHQLVCYAAPIHTPDGTLVGVLDATSTLARAEDGVALAVLGAAEALEHALRLAAYAGAGASVARLLGRSLERMADAAFLVEPAGRIARANRAARALFGDVRSTSDELLGLGWAELRREAVRPTPGGARVELAGHPFRLQAEPIESAGHGLVAIVVTLLAQPVVSLRKAPDPFASFFAEDPAAREAIAWARRIAPSDLPVMLLAETGTGKELVAHSLHAASPRAAGPFIAVNCGSLAPSLLESELFGYVPGAFTGAERAGRQGLIAAASGGTLFLDEVAEMSPAMQAALLRVLEEGEYRRVGGTETASADVRIICATCRDLPALVAAGAFRQDLYFRLKGATIALPPLRARRDQVALARHLVGVLAARAGTLPLPLSARVEAFLAGHAWPGNVRELKATLQVALVLARGAEVIDVEHLPPDLVRAPAAERPPEGALDDVEGWALRRVLREVGGNVSAAAARLGVARSTLYRMMRRHGLSDS